MTAAKPDANILAFLKGGPVAVDGESGGKYAESMPELDLGDERRVLELPKAKRPPPEVAPVTSAAFERAWKVYAQLDGFRRSTKRLSWPQWRLVARVLGEERLEAAVTAFVRDPKAREIAARCGAPGFQVWLRQGRYEHYLDAGQATVVETRTRDALPAEVWEAVAYRWGQDYATSWLHRATVRDAILILPTGTAADRLFRECASELARAGVRTLLGVRDGREVARYRIG